MTLHKIKIKILCLLGLAIDVHSKGKWPCKVLSNFYPHKFKFQGVECGSMEGFLQSLKTQSVKEQRKVCALSGNEAKMCSRDEWKNDLKLYWDGRRILWRDGDKFQALIRRAYGSMFHQCSEFRDALAATGNKRIFHSIGNPNPMDTILTEKEFCEILTNLRKEL